jgi:hypothetical protein
VKARIWKDRETGRWCFDVQGHGLRSTGDRGDWSAALAGALDDMRWIESRQHAWKQS